MSIELTYDSLVVINASIDNYADMIENTEDLNNLKKEVNKFFINVDEILKNNLSFSVPKIYDLVEFEKGITMFNEESNNYGLSKIKDRVFGEIEKCWDENELNYYDGKYAEGFRKCDIEEGDTDYDYPLTIADDWSWIAIYVETDELLTGLVDVLNKARADYKPQVYFQVRDYENNFSEIY